MDSWIDVIKEIDALLVSGAGPHRKGEAIEQKEGEAP